MTDRPLLFALIVILSCVGTANAKDVPAGRPNLQGPQAAGRNYLQNYKDMVFANCLAKAYQGDKGAAADAGSSVSALRDWTYFDMDKSPDAINALIDQFLSKDYSNPLAEAEAKGVKFDFLKCLDLYHSHELDVQAKAYVVKPNHSFRQDYKVGAKSD